MMSDKTQTYSENENNFLLSGSWRRQSWRPPTVIAMAAFLSERLQRNATFLQNATRFSGWYERFAHRVQPFPGWPQLAMELPAAQHLPEISATAVEETSLVSSPDIAISALRTPSPQVQRSVAQSAKTVPQPPPGFSVPNRPAIKLAILKNHQLPINSILQQEKHLRIQAGYEQTSLAKEGKSFSGLENEMGQPSNYSPTTPLPRELYRLILERPSRIANKDKSVIETRLIPNISRSPRQEVQGGFPKFKSSPTKLTETGGARSESSNVLPPPRIGNFGETTSDMIPSPRLAAGTSLKVPTQSAIEKLIDNSQLPASLPGLEVRLLPPKEKELTNRDSKNPTNNWQSKTEVERIAVPGPPTPQLNIEELADRVQQTLLRRHLLECERKGLY